ncbi:YtxH domain-containing protein [Bacillus sp. V33-4]|uniref:YtxH domain-containing protein n=1 Tax=Bacillus sp. V33-4 TaxID=2054169 RepID=UPI0015E11D2A|nr:YtxH domain-containing protein [Bacillus sp. V33-4]
MAQNTMDTEKNSKLLKGIILGGIIGGAVALMDSPTRNKVKGTVSGLKDSSMQMYEEVKQNPGEVKDQMINQFKHASNTLKEAIRDAQSLYEKVNEDVFSRVGEVKEISNDAMSTAKQAKSELMGIGSKVVEAGSEIIENPVNAANSGSNNNMRNSSSNSNSGMSNSSNTGSSSTSSTSTNVGSGNQKSHTSPQGAGNTKIVPPGKNN